MALNWPAIMLGAIVDIASSTLLGILVILLASYALVDDATNTADALRQLDATPVFIFLSGATGLLCSALGGYVAGMRTNNRPLLHAAYSSGASTLLNLASVLGLIDNSMSNSWVVIAMLLSICAAVGGGVMARSRKTAA
ncbi:hypothetical protein [Chitinimonas naiadis]